MKALRRSNTSTSNRPSSSSPALSWIHLRSLLVFASSPVPDRRSFKAPWSHAKGKGGFSRHYWNSLFTPDGKLRDGGIKFLRKARSRGIDPSIRSEVWPFLLGVYDLNSSELERSAVKLRKWKEYEKLRRRCLFLSNYRHQRSSLLTKDKICNELHHNLIENPWSEDYTESPFPARWTGNEDLAVYDRTPDSSPRNLDARKDEEDFKTSYLDQFLVENDSELSGNILETVVEPDPKLMSGAFLNPNAPNWNVEDFRTWQRIIRLDAIRADAEWSTYSPTQTRISQELANHYAKAVALKDYDHLEPCIIYHASRLVSVLEAYAIYDPEIGYCQGMSDLLSPILVVVEDDYEAFWCFVGFMRKARQNFRLDEFGIRRQLAIVSWIIRSKDALFYQHLQKLQAEDCFFVYRMVLVLFRRELNFEQTLCLWEVMWADQAAIRAGIGGSACGRMRLRAPPSEDLVLFAIAGCVLKRRKLFIDKYSNLDEIMKECNNMSGKLDVWRILDDAHDLVITLHATLNYPSEIS
ncbi:TBC1 domain family member 17-like [Phalaenopsis equestris]|uniref:TBC1 domain family member 17-like n=1 Tax=Phalaenopsis equestris TaxID=78828 RepID=UPI0009E29BC0|nr:TBC1 domain family member 17-like [Phalaenopsis equestris]